MFLYNTGWGKKTTDGGLTWQNIQFDFNNGRGNDIEFIGNTPDKVWAINKILSHAFCF